MERKPKVLLVHNYYQIPGGEDTVVANEKRLLEEHGHEVLLYTRHNKEINGAGKLQKLLLPFVMLYNPRTAREVGRILREQRVDIVHVHNTLFLISPAVYYAARRCGVPVVQTIHNFRLLCPGATFYRDGQICEDCVTRGLGCAVKHACYRASRAQTLLCVLSTHLHRLTGIYKHLYYIALTQFNKDKLLLHPQLRAEQIFVKPNYVPARTGEAAREGFIYAGRLDQLKGVDVLLAAWRLLGSDAPRLTVCGSGPMADWCAEQVREYGLNVELKGFVENDTAKALIARSRALILPTMWYEGFPMTILEAYAAGTPVICSDLGNAGSVVEEGVTGWKFEPGSAEALAEAVRGWTDLSESVRRVFEERYTAEANYRELSEIYARVLSAEKGGRS